MALLNDFPISQILELQKMLHQQRDRWTVLILTVQLDSNTIKILQFLCVISSELNILTLFRQEFSAVTPIKKHKPIISSSTFLHIFIHYEHLLLFPECLLVNIMSREGWSRHAVHLVPRKCYHSLLFYRDLCSTVLKYRLLYNVN